MNRNILFFMVLLVMACSSCDEGRIYEEETIVMEEGRVVKMTADITGIDKWAQGYSIVIAGFNETSEYAVTSANIPAPSVDGGTVRVIMSGISDEVKTLEICAINKLRKRIDTFSSIETPATTDTIIMNVGAVDVGMYSAIQNSVFTPYCATCHGASAGSPSANLTLTKGKSYEDLVNHPSVIVDGKLRVTPGNAEESVLYQILNTDISSQWGIDHFPILTPYPNLLTLIDDWIDNGATK